MEVIDKREMHRTVYNHLYDMNYNIVQTIFGAITPELMAIMSHDAYAETIQLAQAGYINDYYNRLTRGAV
jgi:hypothetical protein